MNDRIDVRQSMYDVKDVAQMDEKGVNMEDNMAKQTNVEDLENRIQNPKEVEPQDNNNEPQLESEADAFADALFMEEQPAVQAAYFKIFGLSSLLYAIVYTICMFQNSSGLTMPVWVATTILYASVTMKQVSERAKLCRSRASDGFDSVAASAEGKNSNFVESYGRLWANSWFYIVVMLLLGIATFLTDQTYMICLNYMGFFMMLILFLLHNVCDDRQWDFSKSLIEMIAAVFGAIGCMFVPFTDGYTFCKEKKAGNNRTLRAVLIGMLLAVPAIMFIGFCLVCADAVFDVMVMRLFSGLRVPTKVMEVIGMLLFGYFSSYCGMRYLTRRKRMMSQMHQTAFDPVIAMTFSGMLLVMYLVFCGVQILYLFVGNMQLPEGMTYAGYAHRGFYMLLFVCFINFVLVVFIRKYFAKHKILDGMLLLICGCTFVMMASSAYRMFLYIAAYQLTFLRVLVLAILAALALLMAGVVFTILKTQFSLFRYSIAVVSVVYLCLAFLHVDCLIASYNLSHVNEAERVDWSYLSQLSLDAAPAVADYYADASVEVKNQMKQAALRAKQMTESNGYRVYDEDDFLQEMYWFQIYMCKVYQAENKMGLRNFNLSRYRAVKLFDEF